MLGWVLLHLLVEHVVFQLSLCVGRLFVGVGAVVACAAELAGALGACGCGCGWVCGRVWVSIWV